MAILFRKVLMGFLLMALLSLTSSCHQTSPSDQIRERVQESAKSIVKLRSGEKRWCSAFHIGNGIYLTAQHCEDPELRVQIENRLYPVHVIKSVPDKDILVFRAIPIFHHVALASPMEMTNLIGQSIITLGYPFYAGGDLAFEVSYVLETFTTHQGVKLIVSAEGCYFGESGGPAVSVSTGRVIGLVHALSEQVQIIKKGDEEKEVHKTIASFISTTEVRKVLAENHIKY